MAKYYGKIGFVKDQVETRPSFYERVIEEHYYVGDLFAMSMSTQNADAPTDDFNISNDISIVADAFALNNFSSMRYIEVMGSLWEIKSAKIEHPRIRISVGGIYHGPTPGT